MLSLYSAYLAGTISTLWGSGALDALQLDGSKEEKVGKSSTLPSFTLCFAPVCVGLDLERWLFGLKAKAETNTGLAWPIFVA